MFCHLVYLIYLFIHRSLYTERIFRKVEDLKGVNVGGVNINNLRYADDTALLTETISDIQELVKTVNEKGKPYGMEMNIKNTKTMVVSRNVPVPAINISIEGKQIEQSNNMIYLGHRVTDNGKCEAEIKRRIIIAKASFENMAKILTARKININIKIRLLKCYIWSTLLYGAETWTLTKATVNKLEAFEMWCYRRILRISWTEHKTNKEVLCMLNIKRQLVYTIKKKKLTYFGHIIRKECTTVINRRENEWYTWKGQTKNKMDR